jgi:hypothetical protein
MLKEETESKCRLCKQHEEATGHLTSGCPIFAKNKHKWDTIKFMHICITQFVKPQALKRQADSIHTRPPKPVYEKEVVTLLWNPAVHVDREVTANGPAVKIKNKNRKQ